MIIHASCSWEKTRAHALQMHVPTLYCLSINLTFLCIIRATDGVEVSNPRSNLLQWLALDVGGLDNGSFHSKCYPYLSRHHSLVWDSKRRPTVDPLTSKRKIICFILSLPVAVRVSKTSLLKFYKLFEQPCSGRSVRFDVVQGSLHIFVTSQHRLSVLHSYPCGILSTESKVTLNQYNRSWITKKKTSCGYNFFKLPHTHWHGLVWLNVLRRASGFNSSRPEHQDISFCRSLSPCKTKQNLTQQNQTQTLK